MADKPRTRGKARARLLELLAETTPEQVAVLHGRAPEIEAFADELAATLHFPVERMTFNLLGPSIGPHVGPGSFGAVVLPKVDA